MSYDSKNTKDPGSTEIYLAEHFNTYYITEDEKDEKNKPQPINFDKLSNDLQNKKLTLEDIQTFLIQHIDRQNNIITSKELIDPLDSKDQKHICFVRDATNAIPLNERLDPNHRVFQIDNMLLRTLTTMRGIQHTLDFSQPKDKYDKQDKFSKLLTNSFAQLIKDCEGQDNKIKTLEKKFNALLIRVLHQSHLDSDVPRDNPKKFYQSLLLHYRNLAATLDPAPAMRTIIYDKKNYITHTETSYPITEKTVEQKESLDKMDLMPTGSSGKNYHSAQPLAFQYANRAFKGLISMDNRRLPAQTRKTHAPTVKNGYLVHTVLIHLNTTLNKISLQDHYCFRSGTLVYVGKGEELTEIEQQTHHNIAQLQLYLDQIPTAPKSKDSTTKDQAEDAKKVTTQGPKLHITLLNTNTSRENQDIMYKHTEAVVKATEHQWSYIPVNWQGTWHRVELSEVVKDQAKEHNIPLLSHYKLPSKKRVRAEFAALASAIADLDPNITALVTCASGQDRTGTVREVMEILQARQFYYKAIKKEVSFDKMAALRALGNNNAALSTLAAPGSFGLKSNSAPSYLFKEAVKSQAYRKTANTNKKPALDESLAKQIALSSPNPTLINPLFKILYDKLKHILLSSAKRHLIASLKKESDEKPNTSNHHLGEEIVNQLIASATETKLDEILKELYTNRIITISDYYRIKKDITKEIPPPKSNEEKLDSPPNQPFTTINISPAVMLTAIRTTITENHDKWQKQKHYFSMWRTEGSLPKGISSIIYNTTPIDSTAAQKELQRIIKLATNKTTDHMLTRGPMTAEFYKFLSCLETTKVNKANFEATLTLFKDKYDLKNTAETPYSSASALPPSLS